MISEQISTEKAILKEEVARPPTDCELGVNARGHLTIEGNDSVDLARTFGTPLWVVSEKTLRQNYRALSKAFTGWYPNVTIAYASKANHAPAIMSIMAQEGAWVDCVSLTQLYLARLAGVPPGRIVFNGNNKSPAELEYAIGSGVGIINIDSLDELDMFGETCERLNKEAAINIRLRGAYSALSREDPDFVKAFTADDKFGIDIPSGQAVEAIGKALRMKHVRVLGLSHHVGWSVYGLKYDKELDLRRVKAQVEEVAEFAMTLAREIGFRPLILDLGGGFRKKRPHGFGPGKITSIPSAEEYAEMILSVVKRQDVADAIGRPRVLLEPGGYIASDAITLLSTVGTIKSVDSGPGAGKWVAVDSSAYQFVRKLMFGFYHHTLVANKMEDPPTEVVDIVGSTCAYDYVADKASVPRLEKGDLIATLDQGSYCDTISSQYCAFPRPATVLVSGERSSVVKRREAPEDILGFYSIPEWLKGPKT